MSQKLLAAGASPQIPLQAPKITALPKIPYVRPSRIFGASHKRCTLHTSQKSDQTYHIYVPPKPKFMATPLHRGTGGSCPPPPFFVWGGHSMLMSPPLFDSCWVVHLKENKNFGVGNPYYNFFRASRDFYFITPNQNCSLHHCYLPTTQAFDV